MSCAGHMRKGVQDTLPTPALCCIQLIKHLLDVLALRDFCQIMPQLHLPCHLEHVHNQRCPV